MSTLAPQPFRIHVEDAVLDDLHHRLATTRWPDALPNAGWGYGTSLDYARELCTYWRDDYDWRVHESLSLIHI